MIRRLNKTRAQSSIEYAAVIMFLLASLLYFQKYIVRGLTGRWKGVGDGLGEGRIYDPHKTTECAYKTFFQDVHPVWYDQKCFEQTCGEEDCLRSTRNIIRCSGCLASCDSPLCIEPPLP